MQIRKPWKKESKLRIYLKRLFTILLMRVELNKLAIINFQVTVINKIAKYYEKVYKLN